MEKLLILIPSLTVSELEELFMVSGLSCKKVELNLNETSLIDKGSINKECKKNNLQMYAVLWNCRLYMFRMTC